MRIVITIVVLALSLMFLVATTAPFHAEAQTIDNTTSFITALEPATLQWMDASHVAVGAFDGFNETFNAAGNLLNQVELGGPFYQGSWVGENFSVGAEKLDLEIDIVGGISYKYTVTQVAAAAQIGGFLALGVGQEEIHDTGSDTRTKLPIYGASLRLAEVFFINAHGGVQTSQTSGAADLSRNVRRYSLGYRIRDETSGFSVRYLKETRESYVTSAGVVFGEEENAYYGIQLVFSNILLGVNGAKIAVTNETAGSGFDESRSGFRVGWLPQNGFSLVLRIEKRDRDLTPGTNYQERERTRLAVGYRF
jgi:hypothetical protein